MWRPTNDGALESFEEFLASDPSEEFRNRGNSEQGKDMITLQRNNIPQGQQAAGRGVQFLKPVHVTNPKGMAAKVIKVTSDKPDNFGNPYTVFFSMNSAKYSKGFKPTSDNLAALVEILGADETRWAGKSVTIGKLVDDEGGERLVFTK
jgi:hypothetical protein